MSLFKKSSLKNSVSTQGGQLTNNIEANIEMIKAYMCETEDLLSKEIMIQNKKCAILYLDSMVKKEFLLFSIIDPILENETGDIKNVVGAAELNSSSEISIIGSGLLEGNCIILLENDAIAHIVFGGGTQERSIMEPANERSIKSAHDGFVESLSTNIQLLRKRIKSPQLKVKNFTIGNITNTKVSILYLDHLVNKEILKEVERRINSIKVDQLYSIGEIEEFIEDNSFSPFPHSLATERPDRAVSYLAEGKISIVVDGSPRVLVVPITFFAFYQSPDDYNSRWVVGSFFRLFRILSFVITISLPAIYIAIVSYHSEVLPIGILYSIRVSLEYVPFQPFVEALAMLILLELLKEAAIRLPSPIAQTIGIVGGLVIGTAVVEANLVSNTMIVVIGLTAISSFAAPINEIGTSARLLGFPTMIAASMFGFFGIVFVLMLIFMHLCKLDSYGTPYFAPFAPLKKEDLKDTIVRLPFWKLTHRPSDSRPSYTKQQWYSRVWKKK